MGTSHPAVPEIFQKFSRVSGGQSVRWDRSKVRHNAHRLHLGAAVASSLPWQLCVACHTHDMPDGTTHHGRHLRSQTGPKRAVGGGAFSWDACVSVGKRSLWASAVAEPSGLSPPATAPQQLWGHPSGMRAPGSAWQLWVLSKEVLMSPAAQSLKELGVQFHMYMGQVTVFVFFFLIELKGKLQLSPWKASLLQKPWKMVSNGAPVK